MPQTEARRCQIPVPPSLQMKHPLALLSSESSAVSQPWPSRGSQWLCSTDRSSGHVQGSPCLTKTIQNREKTVPKEGSQKTKHQKWNWLQKNRSNRSIGSFNWLFWLFLVCISFPPPQLPLLRALALRRRRAPREAQGRLLQPRRLRR